MATLIKYKGKLYREVNSKSFANRKMLVDSDTNKATNLITSLIKDVVDMTQKTNKTLESCKSVERYLNEALSALKDNDIKKAQDALSLALDSNKNYTDNSSLIMGIIHAVNALK